MAFSIPALTPRATVNTTSAMKAACHSTSVSGLLRNSPKSAPTSGADRPENVPARVLNTYAIDQPAITLKKLSTRNRVAMPSQPTYFQFGLVRTRSAISMKDFGALLRPCLPIIISPIITGVAISAMATR